MVSLTVRIVETINHFFAPPTNLTELDAAKTSIEAYQKWELAEIQRIHPEFGPRWEIKGKQVLDIGCGLGGKTQYYAARSPAAITSIDLRQQSLEAAQMLNRQAPAATRFVLADAARVPFEDDSFDVIVSVNVFEHVDDLENTLQECRRIIKPGGCIFLHFPPFYSPWGAHLEGWINFPWPHVFFSDQALIQAAHRVDERNKQNENYIPSAQVDWAALDCLPELNRITVAGFLQLVDQVELTILEATMLPVGRHYLPQRGTLGKWALVQLKRLANLPTLREYLTTKMVFVLTKS